MTRTVRKSPLDTGLAPGTLLARCTCNAVKLVMSDGLTRWQQSIAVFSQLPVEVCSSCVEKHGDRGITELPL
jgi:hypothetical protein